MSDSSPIFGWLCPQSYLRPGSAPDHNQISKINSSQEVLCSDLLGRVGDKVDNALEMLLE